MANWSGHLLTLNPIYLARFGFKTRMLLVGWGGTIAMFTIFIFWQL
jgi:hypothetical protein